MSSHIWEKIKPAPNRRSYPTKRASFDPYIRSTPYIASTWSNIPPFYLTNGGVLWSSIKSSSRVRYRIREKKANNERRSLDLYDRVRMHATRLCVQRPHYRESRVSRTFITLDIFGCCITWQTRAEMSSFFASRENVEENLRDLLNSTKMLERAHTHGRRFISVDFSFRNQHFLQRFMSR